MEGCDMVDVVVVGGGPAGLNAALMLGRARGRVLVCDTGAPRNAVTHESHGFLSRDGTDPAEMLRVAREQLGRYDGVELLTAGVEAAHRDGDRFEVTLADGSSQTARRLLATGVVDELPPIQGLGGLWGRSVFNCPYCDGWECVTSRWPYSWAARPTCASQRCCRAGAPTWCGAPTGPSSSRAPVRPPPVPSPIGWRTFRGRPAALQVVDRPEDGAADLVVTSEQPVGHGQHLAPAVAAQCRQQHGRPVED
jgi:choline dehydrogenase-like flavoprotein